MPCLSVFSADHPQQPGKVLGWPEHVRDALAQVGVRYAQNHPLVPLHRGCSDAEVLAAYAQPVAQLQQERSGLRVQVVRIDGIAQPPGAPHAHCLDEHSHAEDELHLFVSGQALLSLHVAEQVFQLLCEKGDLLLIPAGSRHWFDYGEQPRCVSIRLLGREQAGLVELSGEPIARRFARLDDFAQQ